jgi:hypothetical protein
MEKYLASASTPGTSAAALGASKATTDYLDGIMTDTHDLKRDIKKLRDELELKMHLASMEMKEEWQELEGRWQKFSSKTGLDESAQALGGSLEALGEELKNSYKRFRAGLKD